MHQKTPTRAAVMAASAALALGLAACSPAGGAERETNPSAEADWDSLEPMEFRMATFGGEENLHSQPLNALAETMEEVSGGKLTFEIFYGGALVPSTEQGIAISNGITDMGTFFPAYTASEYPADEWASPLAFTPDDSPVVGSLQAIGTTLDWAYQTPEYLEDITSKGITPLLPRIQTSHAYNLLCKDEVTTLADVQGKRIRIGGPTHTAEVEALGGVPVALPNTEVFEGLQRGVIDCTVATLTDIVNVGLAEVAQNFTFVPFSGWSSNVFGVNTDVWEGLPDFVREAFLDDGLSAYLEAFVQAEMAANVEVAQMEELTFLTPSDEIVDVLDGYHEAVLESRRSATGTPLADPDTSLDLYLETSDKWLGLVQDAGYDGAPANWNEYVAAHDGELPDFGPWLELVLNDVVKANHGS
ncbi:TRAP transporter substrate-binding protein DctP [Salinibacterium sp. ZJ454]|uniref:TRAP transporter substrate-binding protein DctP n=1 Tax=Salinibacterium sp. ZJ454 TaxID=2708339 RepID=UPI001420FFFF|nr:TRAP transporter substrate-binding protein DctP [Salinibacterium sp. ZJ454]